MDYSSGVDEFEAVDKTKGKNLSLISTAKTTHLPTDQNFLANDVTSARTSYRRNKSRIHLPDARELELPEDFRKAVVKGDMLAVKQLLDNGIDPNVKLKSNWTPVMYAADSGRVKVLEMLHNHFANSNSQCDKYTALMVCCASKQTDVVALLTTELLLKYGAKLNSEDKLGMTPFLYAAKHNHISILPLLASYGAKVNKQDKNGWSALCFSAKNGNSNVTLVLLGCGCDATPKTTQGETAVDIATRRRHHQVLEILNSYLQKNEVLDQDSVKVQPISTYPMICRYFKIILLIISLLLLVLSAIFYVHTFHGISLNFPTISRTDDRAEFEECVSGLSRLFPNQEPILWRKFSNHIRDKMFRSKTVLCHTIITNESNLDSLNCMLKKIANCLKITPIIFPEDTKLYTPNQMSDNILSKLMPDSSQFVIFNNTSTFAYPLPVLFHSICDPDYTSYPQSYFYFTFPTNETLINEPNNPELAKLVEKALLQSWSNDQYKREEAIASIVRITEAIYHIRNEENGSCLIDS